ncbi:MAG TPA: hypothetical protein PK796_01910 [Bacteroidales bacterium]|nr:hypothetical protein [Bacteroidales bacterium]
MNNQELTYECRIVAFIDILGFKEIVKQSVNDTSRIQLIYSVLEYLKDWETTDKWDLKLVEIEEDAQYRGVENFDIRGKTNCTSFSDSIVISVKVDNNVNEMASTLVSNLSYIGAVLLEKGILFRGGMTIGNIIHNDNGTVFGQGLIDAYQLESKSAKYPRIILSDKLISELNFPIDAKRNRYPYHQYIDRFDDGCVGFHQMIYFQVMENWTEMTQEKLTSSLSKIRKVIINGLDASFENPEIFEKYKWLSEQYNNLIILSDFDVESKTEEHVKLKIRNLNLGISGQNIHYSYTDDIYDMRRKKDAR